jgi:tetratricopeptide (TPR) repeat protein
VDLQQAGRDMGVTSIVTGHFLREGDHLEVTLEAVDAANDRSIWRDSVDVAASDKIAMRREITAKIREGLIPALGVRSAAFETDTRPRNEKAYDLFLRSISVPHDGPPNKEAMAMLEHSVELDPEYAPAWEALAYRYYFSSAYGDGGELMGKRSDSALERALALDPNLISASSALISNRTEEGETANTYAEASALVKRWPESAHAHFALSYVLRYAGFLEQAAQECETAAALDPGNYEFRSCAVVFMLLDKPQRAMDFVRLDPGSEWAARTAAEIFLRQGKLAEARESIQKTSASLLMGQELLSACFDSSRTSELKSIAKKTEAVAMAGSDAEPRYLVGTLLAHCGQIDAALRLLTSAAEQNYCAYTAMQTDPLLVKVRQRPEFPQLLSSGRLCQSRFLEQKHQSDH